MFKDYTDAVVKEYHKQVFANTISLNLISLTPANVKRECKAVCEERFRKKDERILRDVFGHAEDQKGYLQAIERCDIDKFRPMIKFVEGRSKKTDSKNIELLAWLIDFKDRPFDLKGKYGGAIQPTLVNKSQPVPNDPVSAPVVSGQQRSSFIARLRELLLKRQVLVSALIVALFAGGGIYFSANNPKPANKITNTDSCMYWKDDHYERISCGKKVQYSKVIALDLDLLNYFKRITIPDTITYKSIGKVWYIKIDGEPEFYTWMGYHPIFMQLQLKPITKYIIDNHIRKNILSDNIEGSSLMKLKTPPSSIYRCQAITKTKTQCSRKATSGSFCWQHKKQGV